MSGSYASSNGDGSSGSVNVSMNARGRVEIQGESPTYGGFLFAQPFAF